MNKPTCKCGRYWKCPIRIRITGAGVISTKSSELLKCGEVHRQIEIVGRLKLNNPNPIGDV